MEVTGRSEDDCKKINEILNNTFLIGKNNKQKMMDQFCEALKIDKEQADELYNQCMGVIVKGIFKRKD